MLKGNECKFLYPVCLKEEPYYSEQQTLISKCKLFTNVTLNIVQLIPVCKIFFLNSFGLVVLSTKSLLPAPLQAQIVHITGKSAASPGKRFGKGLCKSMNSSENE